MKAEEIREIAMDSSSAYLNYLEMNEKGVQEVSIFKLSYVDEDELIINLRISAKLFDIDAVYFKDLRNGEKYDTTEIKIIEYDQDHNILLIKPREEFRDEFLDLSPHELLVITDLKFLVERVKTWYELNGANISLPEKSAITSLSLDNLAFLQDAPPSSEQIQAINNIFKFPFSYIWGPPGTGKTQFVLAYSVLHYLRNNKRVAILAPTNNAIEQVLRGVMKITQQVGISRNSIIRLGVPTKKFAEEFPEICEEKGIDKQLRSINQQIAILGRVYSYNKSCNQLITLQQGLNGFDEFSSLVAFYKSKEKQYLSAIDDLKRCQIHISYLKEQLNELKKKEQLILNRFNTFKHKVINVFSFPSPSFEERLEKIKKDKIRIAKNIDFSTCKLTDLKKKTFSHFEEKLKYLDRVELQLHRLKSTFAFYADIVEDMDCNNWVEKQMIIKDRIDILKQKLKVDKELLHEYEGYSTAAIQANIAKYIRSRDRLRSHSTEERLKGVQVIACTLDGYIGRYGENKLEVDHIFLDEAGYANIIKALTLFNQHVPISFLGDHMQLPPVSEINDGQIERQEEYKNMFLWSQSAIWIKTLFSKNRDQCLKEYLTNAPFTKGQMQYAFLSSTFRFGNDLARVLGKHVYAGHGFKSEKKKGETVIYCVDAKKQEGPKSRVSMMEVEKIAGLVLQLKSQGKEFVILTPYKNQVKELGNRLPEERNNLRISTVHGSQGREWDTVILSVVDTFDKWFVDSENSRSNGANLINTAVSRAKKNLIIVCDKEYWSRQRGQLITDLINGVNRPL